MKNRHRCIPASEIKEGMILSTRSTVIERGFLSLDFPAGHVLTEENVQQLKARCAEFIDVHEIDKRSDEEVSLNAAQSAHRVLHTFEGADLNDPTMSALFDQVIWFRSE